MPACCSIPSRCLAIPLTVWLRPCLRNRRRRRRRRKSPRRRRGTETRPIPTPLQRSPPHMPYMRCPIARTTVTLRKPRRARPNSTTPAPRVAGRKTEQVEQGGHASACVTEQLLLSGRLRLSSIVSAGVNLPLGKRLFLRLYTELETLRGVWRVWVRRRSGNARRMESPRCGAAPPRVRRLASAAAQHALVSRSHCTLYYTP